MVTNKCAKASTFNGAHGCVPALTRAATGLELHQRDKRRPTPAVSFARPPLICSSLAGSQAPAEQNLFNRHGVMPSTSSFVFFCSSGALQSVFCCSSGSRGAV